MYVLAQISMRLFFIYLLEIDDPETLIQSVKQMESSAFAKVLHKSLIEETILDF